MMSKKQLTEYCNKPALTVHCKKNCTLTVAGVAVISSIVLMHIFLCKLSRYRKQKLKETKQKLKTEKQQASE